MGIQGYVTVTRLLDARPDPLLPPPTLPRLCSFCVLVFVLEDEVRNNFRVWHSFTETD